MGSSFILAENEWKELLRKWKSVPRSPNLNEAHSHPKGGNAGRCWSDGTSVFSHTDSTRTFPAPLSHPYFPSSPLLLHTHIPVLTLCSILLLSPLSLHELLPFCLFCLFHVSLHVFAPLFSPTHFLTKSHVSTDNLVHLIYLASGM